MIGPDACPLASILVTSPGSELLIALSVTHLLPRASIAIANGFDSPPPVMTLAARWVSVRILGDAVPDVVRDPDVALLVDRDSLGRADTAVREPRRGRQRGTVVSEFGHVRSAGEVRARERRRVSTGVVAGPDVVSLVDRDSPPHAFEAAALDGAAVDRLACRAQRDQTKSSRGTGSGRLEVVAHPNVAVRIERHPPRPVESARRVLQRQHPRGRRSAQLRAVAVRLSQREQPGRVVRRIARDVENRLQRIRGHRGARRSCGDKQAPTRPRAALGAPTDDVRQGPQRRKRVGVCFRSGALRERS